MVHNTNNDDEFAFVFDSPTTMSPWNPTSPFTKSPWSNFNETVLTTNIPQNSLMGSLFREEGHIYSLSVKDNILYTGSDSKNIRVWKNMQEFAAFKSNSGFIKAIILSDDKIFTGHQDGKIRVWEVSPKNPSHHKRVATLPMFFDVFKASIRPKNYVKVKRKRSTLWLKHADAISCMSMNPEKEFLYSGSWDRTFKVWRVKDLKCVESVKAHDDAVNAMVATIDGVVYTGSADGMVKVWRREQKGNYIKHFLLQTLLSQECAITALAVNDSGEVVYGGSSDGLVNFWEWKKKELAHGGVLKGHKVAVLCLAAAGSLVVSGSADKSICVWRRAATGVHSCLSVLSGHGGPVKCLAVEEDKEYSGCGDRRWVVYSGSLDKSVNVWSISEMVPCYKEEVTTVQHVGGGINWESILSAKY